MHPMMLDGDLGFSKSGPVPVTLPINAAFFEATQRRDPFAYSSCPFAGFSRQGQE
jgi:hypothetical protein